MLDYTMPQDSLQGVLGNILSPETHLAKEEIKLRGFGNHRMEENVSKGGLAQYSK